MAGLPLCGHSVNWSSHAVQRRTTSASLPLNAWLASAMTSWCTGPPPASRASVAKRAPSLGGTMASSPAWISATGTPTAWICSHDIAAVACGPRENHQVR